MPRPGEARDTFRHRQVEQIDPVAVSGKKDSLSRRSRFQHFDEHHQRLSRPGVTDRIEELSRDLRAVCEPCFPTYARSAPAPGAETAARA